MKVSEFWKWCKENKLEEADMYVDNAGNYEEIEVLWESEKNGGSVIIEVAKNSEK